MNPLVRRQGITLLELLLVLAIVATMLALILPAVQVARESARIASCQSNLRQLALGLLNHESAFRKLPSNGWGCLWVGDPDSGSLQKQPGSWLYSILPYIEQQRVWSQASGLTGNAKLIALSYTLEAQVPTMVCPSRRGTALTPFFETKPLRNALLPEMSFKSDYAGNGGTFSYNRASVHPLLDDSNYPAIPSSFSSGAFFIQTPISMSDFRDGCSNVFLIGEKYVRTTPISVSLVRDIGDDQSAFIGDDVDNRRFGHSPPSKDGPEEGYEIFGSRHTFGVNMCMIDGSCRKINFGIDRDVFYSLSNRLDGNISEE